MSENVYNKIYNAEDWGFVLPENKKILEDFLVELRQNRRAKGTIYQYTNDLRIFLIFIYKRLGNRNILTLNKRDLKQFSLWLTEELNVSVARHNRLLSSMRSLFNYCEEDDERDYTNDVARKIKGLAGESVREIHFLSDAQVLKVEELLIKREQYQLATLFMLAYDSAGRRNELAQVTKDSFYNDKNSLTNKVIGKRRKSFSLAYFQETKRCAKLWLEQRGEDEFKNMWVYKKGDKLYPVNSAKIYTMFMQIKDVLTELEGKETQFNVHSMRHSTLQNMSDGSHYICRILNLGKLDLQVLKTIANHEKIDTTEGYLKEDRLSVLDAVFGIRNQ